MNKTEKYYFKNTKEYIEKTQNIDMVEEYNFFIKYLDKSVKNTMLDLGFGSGRDSLFFSEYFDVVSIDSNPKFVRNLKNKKRNIKVYRMKAQRMNFKERFTAVWAQAILNHFSDDQILKILNKIYRSLKNKGIVYISLKLDNINSDERYYNLKSYDEFQLIIDKTDFIVLDKKYSVSRTTSENWLSIILQKDVRI